MSHYRWLRHWRCYCLHFRLSKTQSGWLWFFVLALPATFAGELAGDFIFRNRVAQAIEERSQSKSFSLLRVLDGFIAMLIAFGMAWGLALHFGADKV
jgi:hypothetical protein